MTLIPFDDRDGFIWMDGRMVPWREATVHVLTHGLHYASSVFEGERAYNGQVFKLTEHSTRLQNSARLLGFDLPYDVQAINDATNAVLKANGITDGYVRPLAWRGSEVMGVAAQQSRIHVAIACWSWPSYFSPEAKMAGIRLMISPWRRPAPDTAPTQSKAAGLYMISTMSKHAAENAGWDDALMLDYRGLVAEASAANLFLVIDGALQTPTPTCFLNGITRQTVMALARDMGLTVVEREIELADFALATEVFLTGSAAEVTPVRQVGDWHFTPGAVCQQMINAYSQAVGR